MIWEFAVFETFFDAWWLDFIVAPAVFFVGVYVLERQIGKICGTIEEELGKKGETRVQHKQAN